MQITDADVIAAGAADRHPIVRPTGQPDDLVAGTVLTLTTTELAAADTYEVDVYRRVAVRVSSGQDAWLYLADD